MRLSSLQSSSLVFFSLFIIASLNAFQYMYGRSRLPCISQHSCFIKHVGSKAGRSHIHTHIYSESQNQNLPSGFIESDLVKIAAEIEAVKFVMASFAMYPTKSARVKHLKANFDKVPHLNIYSGLSRLETLEMLRSLEKKQTQEKNRETKMKILDKQLMLADRQSKFFFNTFSF